KLHCFHKIYEQITSSPGMPIYEIAANTTLSRNTVSKYLQEMIEDCVLLGPQLRLLPSSTHKEYVYLMNFRNPYHLYHNLSGFPHVLYHAMTFGDWNAMVITDQLIDFSQLVGFENILFQGVRYHSYTPETVCIPWSEGFERCSHQIKRFTPHTEYKNRTLPPALTWGEDQWKMYYAFKDTTRKTATTTLKKIGVRYEEYVTWMEDLKTHCTYHTGFYPEGYYTYLTYCFLFSTDYEQTVKDLFSSFPTTPFIIEVGNNILVFTSVILSELKRKLFCCIYDMKTQGIIKTFNHASLIFQTSLKR
ncbi:MAG: winged helix-turn-helix domain-containing protein, partial [Candidatus Methanofastidiosia archaeon]